MERWRRRRRHLDCQHSQDILAFHLWRVHGLGRQCSARRKLRGRRLNCAGSHDPNSVDDPGPQVEPRAQLHGRLEDGQRVHRWQQSVRRLRGFCAEQCGCLRGRARVCVRASGDDAAHLCQSHLGNGLHSACAVQGTVLCRCA
eukprot:Amastigsp_a342544_21.p3 type:complete len:143 gc:universal Amastigsp_a342544_21:826-398(-)